MPVCRCSGESFEITDFEAELRRKLGAPAALQLPRYTWQHLLSFWHHFALHKRACDRTGKTIISVFDESCPYPVWDHTQWYQHADPPGAEYHEGSSFFEQLWDLFQRCPIPHNVEVSNENCEYTDDWWNSKDCYLGHSGYKNENCQYCYRSGWLNSCQFCVFAHTCELSVDLVNCFKCYAMRYGIHCRNCRDSAFLFDCRNCEDCILCWNLRNRRFCVENKQLTEAEFLAYKENLELHKRGVYEATREKFEAIILNQAWWRALEIEKCEECTGNFLEGMKNCKNCFFSLDMQDCVNIIRGYKSKDCLDSVCCYGSELVYMSAMVQETNYDIQFCYDVVRSKRMRYSAHCWDCEDCFACCGLVRKKYHIFNREYPEAEYHSLVEKVVTRMKEEGVWGEFFPAYFAANPYDESLAGFYFPLSIEQQKDAGYRISHAKRTLPSSLVSSAEIPDDPFEAPDDISTVAYRDEDAGRPFQITDLDLRFAKANHVPIPNSFYISRIKQLFAWMFFDGELRSSTCAKSGADTLTTAPPALDARLLSEKAYLDTIVG